MFSTRFQKRSPTFLGSELAVHSCPLLCVAKLDSGFFCCWSLLRNNNMVYFELRYGVSPSVAILADLLLNLAGFSRC